MPSTRFNQIVKDQAGDSPQAASVPSRETGNLPADSLVVNRHQVKFSLSGDEGQAIDIGITVPATLPYRQLFIIALRRLRARWHSRNADCVWPGARFSRLSATGCPVADKQFWLRPKAAPSVSWRLSPSPERSRYAGLSLQWKKCQSSVLKDTCTRRPVRAAGCNSGRTAPFAQVSDSCRITRSPPVPGALEQVPSLIA